MTALWLVTGIGVFILLCLSVALEVSDVRKIDPKRERYNREILSWFGE